MSRVPVGQCDKCKPDCDSTTYSYSATASPFRRCDFKNLGISDLCNFDTMLNPPIWGNLVAQQYLNETNSIPKYVSSLYTSNIRKHVTSRNEGNQVPFLYFS